MAKRSYYNEDGRPLRKTFLRTPVEFTRISSVFSVGRMHPILGYMRAHKGVDYAAPTGTPIRAAGDGKITFRGWKSGYGNFVIVQHNGHISTAYGHMSAFANEKLGQHVGQGQVIGYVGMTGLATGPHLHYEFRVDGEHRNPLTVTLPKEEPLPADTAWPLQAEERAADGQAETGQRHAARAVQRLTTRDGVALSRPHFRHQRRRHRRSARAIRAAR